MPPLQSFLDGKLLTWTTPAMLGLPFTGSAYLAPSGEVVWIDPPDPAGHEAELLKLGPPQHVLVTFRDHDRHVAPIAKKYGCKVWVPRGEGGDLAPDELFHGETRLPAGLKAVGLPAMGYGEHALVAEAYGKRFAFIGDAVFNLEGTSVPWLVRKLAFAQKQGPLAMKRSYRGGDTKAAAGQLRQLLDHKLDMLFLSHGAAIASDADRRLREVLGDA